MTRFLELGPDAVLAGMARLALRRAATSVTVIAAQRKGRDDIESFVGFLADAHTAGVDVDWNAFYAGRGARRVDLPTYAFQHERYWPRPGAGGGDLGSLGLSGAGHPLLPAQVRLASGDEWLFTGRLSLDAQPWVADHTVFGTVLMPGTGLVELALAAGRAVDCTTLDELTLEGALVFADGVRVQVQVAVGEPADDGSRPVAVYSRPDHLGGEGEPEPEWVRHAHGVLTPDAADADASTSATAAPDAAERLAAEAWPPEGAEPVAVDGLYERLAELGYEYGPAFQGVTAAWRRGDDLFAEVAPGDAQGGDAARCCLHPALFDAAFHVAIAALADQLEPGRVPLPFAFRGVRVHRQGAPALRVQLAMTGTGETLTLAAVDDEGAPVLAMDALDSRAVDAAQLRAAGGRNAGGPLYAVEWAEVALPTPAEDAAAGDRHALAVLGDLTVGAGAAAGYADLAALIAALDDGAPTPDGALAVVAASDTAASSDTVRAGVLDTLALVQGWLAEPRLADARLVLITRGAVAARPGDVPDLPAAAAAGLVRSAHAEHPGRFLHVDLDARPDPGADDQGVAADVPWRALLAADEPQLALRNATAYAPRLARGAARSDASPADRAPDEGLFARGTVLVTGGTGGLGALVARHLASRYQARHLLLVSRRGPQAPGAAELVDDLAALGCEATVAACDVADRDSVTTLLAGIAEDRPLTAVIHTAGVLDDGTVESLTAEQVDRVLRPKVDAALHLHDLTRHDDLTAFVLFSSGAPLLGGAGQGNYAAANATLDALAQHRRAHGLAGLSLAWGLWDQAVGMAGELDDALFARFARQVRDRLGILPLGVDEGLGLLDAALAQDEALVAPVKLDLAGRRAAAAAGNLQAVLRSLVRAPARRDRGGASLALLLGGVPEANWDGVILDLVRGRAAAVLGYETADAVEADRAFKDLGFDSLAAVEFRNGLVQATGVRLPATLVFDHPTPLAVSSYLRTQAATVGRRVAAVAAAPARTDEPLAIVGMGCRYPGGVGSPEDLWRLVESGADVITGFPTDRGWDLERLYDPDPARLRTSYTRHGGFLDDVSGFDARFFGIGPREALAMDPQQRLLLEVAWETFEDAGIDPALAAWQRYGRVRGRDVRRLRAHGDVQRTTRRGRGLPHRRWGGQCGLGPAVVRVRVGGPGGHGRHGVLVVAGRPAPGLPGRAGGRRFAGLGGRRVRHVLAVPVRGVQPPTGPLARWPLQGVRGRGRRRRLVGGRRPRAGRAAVGCGGEGPSGVGGGAGFGGEPGRGEQWVDGAERAVAGAGDPRRVGERGAVSG